MFFYLRVGLRGHFAYRVKISVYFNDIHKQLRRTFFTDDK